MDRYTRILVLIFLICIINLGLSVYLINKAKDKINPIPVVNNSNTSVLKSPSPTTKAVELDSANFKSELGIIKAEIRALRDSLETSGLILTTPEP